MSVEKKKVVKVIFTIVISIILLLLSWILIGGKSFAKYKSEANATHLAEVAKPVFVVDGAQDIQINGMEDTVYEFEIKNYDETAVNSVNLKYDIEIINNSKADLEFELSKNGERVNLTENKTVLNPLKPRDKQTDSYSLKIKYHNNPAVTSDIQGNVQIKTQAVQDEK